MARGPLRRLRQTYPEFTLGGMLIFQLYECGHRVRLEPPYDIRAPKTPEPIIECQVCARAEAELATAQPSRRGRPKKRAQGA
jgi:hypothetical protein